MSDEFDKEAEREKLREKFEEDRQDREHTQRMSELLLQGATMTNRHCETCGDPIFSHEDREFCPTCHATEDGYEVPADGVEADGTSVDEPAGPGSAEGDAVRSDDPRDAGDPTAAHPGETAVPPNDTPVAPNDTPVSPNDTPVPPSDASSSDRTAPEATNRPPSATHGVDDARASLTRTLTRFARAAESTDDPRRAREHLTAAREAAETLSALEK